MIETRSMKILLPVDGSLCSLAAAREVAQRPWPKGSRVRILYVADRPMIDPQALQTLPKSVISHWQRTTYNAIDKALAEFDIGADAPLAIETEILHGHPKEVILDEADEWGADLIVLGSHGYGAVDRFLLGSISNAVALHAKCSVEVVRSRFANEVQHAAPTV